MYIEIKKFYAICVLILALIIGGIWYYLHQEKAPEIVSVPSTTTQDIRPVFPKESESTVEDISHQITRVKEIEVPKYKYYTVTQEAADARAETIAKEQKADKVVKETNVVAVKDAAGKDTEQSVIENAYYGINLDRKHKIKIGGASIDGITYLSAGYQNRDIDYKAYYSPEKKVAGLGVDVTIAKW